MAGFDYHNFWLVGRLILSGANPYSYPISFYPPAATFLFALFALLPFQISFGLWSGFNVAFILDILRRKNLGWKSLLWLAFAPVIFTLSTGQNDIFFLWLAGFVNLKGWKGAIFAALLTLKPQIAFILLPWYLVQWLRTDRKQLIRWGGLTLTLHLLPLLYDPRIYSYWLHNASGESDWRLPSSPGIFALSYWNIPLIIMLVLAVAIVIYGLIQREAISRCAQILALPFGLWYENVVMVGTVPWWLLVPVSWLAFYAAYRVHNNLPFTILPLLAFTWLVTHPPSPSPNLKIG